ncbi:MAG: AEC family transporter [Rhizobiales bacterium]|nr:AEC family transporter [Hyphomicrobiales bacterium]MBI3674571.1 AEC family transporter [Hyphomicrobiales bacterium]
MTAIFLALLPVFLVILVGFALRRSGLIDAGHWDAVNHVCYFLLFPAIIFKEIAAADFSGVPVFGMAFAMMLAVITMFTLLLATRRPLSRALGIDGPQFTSLVQGASRWHTFMAFAIIPLYFGPKALALGAVSAAAMTPLLNVLCVVLMSRYAEGHDPDLRAILRSIVRNPFVISSLGGVAWQVLHLPRPEIGIQVLDMIGKGALGLALLTVGAGLRVEAAMAAKAPVLAATALKLLVMPLFMAFWLAILGVTGEAAAVALLTGAVPTGSGAYVLAKRMGGDAPLVANILTLQVICAAVTIPLVLAVL